MEVNEILLRARAASKQLIKLSDDRRNDILLKVADALEANSAKILSANALDLEKMPETDSRYDRLRLTDTRIADIAADTRNVARLASPLRLLEERVLPNGLQLRKQAVPFGVIGIIYEARPNVSVDVFSLCFKSANACVLKGGHDAEQSNEALVTIIREVLEKESVDPDVVTLLPSTRQATDLLLNARGLVDLIIPRGSSGLIEEVRRKATVPVIETGAGVCHCYIDSSADMAKAVAIVDNAKTRRVSVCNALDCMVVHKDRLDDLAKICLPLAAKNVVIHADQRAYERLQNNYPAELLRRVAAEDFGTEFLSLALAIRTVDSIDEALDHIARYGSGHSESIVTESEEQAERFQRETDAACVYVNAPTSFTDGAQFGLGAEIGISTQKMHARGPMALNELTTYKWLINGEGQVRP